MPTVPPPAITDAERAERQRRVRAHTSPQRAAKRARMVLLAADGLPNRQVAPMVGMNEHTVAQWRRRFATERLAGSPTASGRAAPGLRPRPAATDPGHRDPAAPTRPATGATRSWPESWPTWASRPPRSAGSWPTWISSRTGCAAGSPGPMTQLLGTSG